MSRTIAISDEVYELLKKSKMPGESFSTVIKRNLKNRGKLSDLIGRRTITSDDWKEIKMHLSRAQEKTARELAGR